MKTLVIILCLLATTCVWAEDSVELEGTSIIGSRELPKILYIVPWKNPSPDSLIGRPVASLLDEVLGALDRDVFRRQVEYYEFIEGNDISSAPQ